MADHTDGEPLWMILKGVTTMDLIPVRQRPPRYSGRHRNPASQRRWRAANALAGLIVLVLVGVVVWPASPASSVDTTARVEAGQELEFNRALFCATTATTADRDAARLAIRRAYKVLGEPYVAPSCVTPTPSPSPTGPSPTAEPSSPTPTGPPAPHNDCMRQTDRCGWPTTATAGVPVAIKATLPPMPTGTNTTPVVLGTGAVLERVQTNRCYKLDGNNITIRYVVFRTACTMVIDAEHDPPLTGIVIDHVELDLSQARDGLGRGYPYNFNVRAISGDGFTLTNSYCHSGGDCVHYGGDIVIQNNLIDIAECTVLPACSNMHIDGLHSASGHRDPSKRHVRIEHNTIIMRGTGDGHPNAAIINGPDISPDGYRYPQGVVLILDNLMAGGGAVVYCAAHPEDTPSHTAEIWGNRISDLIWPRGGKWGPFYHDCMQPSAPGRLSNVWDRTGEVIQLGSWS